jgi:hypothetical protein
LPIPGPDVEFDLGSIGQNQRIACEFAVAWDGLSQQLFVGPSPWNAQGDFDRVTSHLNSSWWKMIVPRCEFAILSNRGSQHAFLVQSIFIGQPIPAFPNPRDCPELLARCWIVILF